VQREISEDVRSSAFAVSETLHQLSWVIGGLAGLLVSILDNGQAGLAITAAFLAVALVYLISRRRQRIRSLRAPATPRRPTGPAARTAPLRTEAPSGAASARPTARSGHCGRWRPRGAASASERAPGAVQASRGGGPEERRASSRRSLDLRRALVQGSGGRRGAKPPWETEPGTSGLRYALSFKVTANAAHTGMVYLTNVAG
jgi:hypothetical protein